MIRAFLGALALLAIAAFLAFTEPPSRERAVITDATRARATALLPERDGSELRDTTNLLILGKAGAGWTAGELTDTILLAVIEPGADEGEAHRLSLISIPRDLLVRIPGGGTAKINALWAIGKSGAESTDEASALIRDAVQDVTGIPVSDTLIVDVAAAERVIDALGGITVNVEERIDDPAFPTAGGGTQRLTIEPGFHVLDGKTAVRYARTRHTREGDFGRLRRQHQIIETVLAKARGLDVTNDIPKILAIYRTLSGNVETTLSIEDIFRITIAAHDIPLARINTFALETIGREPLLAGTTEAALIPRAGTFDYRAIRAAITDLLNE